MKALWFVSKWPWVEHDGHHWDVISNNNSLLLFLTVIRMFISHRSMFNKTNIVYISNDFEKLFSAFFWCSWFLLIFNCYEFLVLKTIQVHLQNWILLFKWNCFETMIVHCISKWNRKWPNRNIRIYKIDYHLDVFCSGQSHNHL